VTAVLEVRQLSARYGRVEALHDISLSVLDGEFVAVLGPNGAGKSTLMRAIMGLVANSGEVRFGGGYFECHTETGTVPDIDEAFIDDRIWQAFDDVVPPLGLAEWVLESYVVLRQYGGHMNVGGEADQAVEDAVRGD